MAGQTENRKVYISINGKEIKNTYRGIRNEVNALKGQLLNTTRGTDEFVKKSKQLDVARKQFEKVKKEVGFTRKGLGGLRGGISQVMQAFLALGALSVFREITLHAFNLRKELGKLAAVLRNSLGDDLEAEGAMSMIQDFAQNTPFAVRQLTDSFVKLVNRGIKPTREELTKMGDLASFVGKEFDQLTEAILDAQTGEFERLKEFGIRANKEGDKVTFTFKGQAKQVKFTKDAITDYIYSLGELKGVKGSMAAISNELAGATSNLGDSYDNLLNTIFSNDKALTKLIRTMSSILDVTRESIRAGGLLSKEELDEINKTADADLKRTKKRIEAAAGTSKRAWKDWEGRIRTAIKSVDKQIEEGEGRRSAVAQLRLVKQRDNYLQLISYVRQHTGEVQKESLKEIQARQKVQKQIEGILLKAAGSEEDQIRDKYEKLIALAKKHKVDLVDQLTDQMNAELIEKISEQGRKEIEAEKQKQEEKERELREFAEKRKEILEKYDLLTDGERLEEELNLLKTAYDSDLLNFEEYQAAQDRIREFYTEKEKERVQGAQEEWMQNQQRRLDSASEFVNVFTDLFTTMRDLELSRIKEVSREDFEVTRRRGESHQSFQDRKRKSEQQFTQAKAKEESKRRAIAKKYAIAEALSSIARIGINTAEAVMKALAILGPILGPIAATGIGITGGIQTGIALKDLADIKGYAEGGITKGLGFKDSSGFEVAGVVHEKEQIIPYWMRKSPLYAKTLDALEYARMNDVGRYSIGDSPVIATTNFNSAQVELDTLGFDVAVGKFYEAINKLVTNGVLAVADDDFQRAMNEKRDRDLQIEENSTL